MLHIAKCPYRISLLGGGSDIDWWLKEGNTGHSFGFSLNIHSYVIVKESIEKKGTLNYSSRETYDTIQTISHPLIREALIELNQTHPIELSSFGSHSSGGGLGGSSSFLNCLLGALYSLQNKKKLKSEIAQLSSKIEINNLHKPIGRQDQFLTALGGVNFFKYEQNGAVSQAYKFNNQQINKFAAYIESCLLIPTKKSRSADIILSAVKNSNSSSEQIHIINNNAKLFLKSIQESDDLDTQLLGRLINDSWESKRSMVGVLNQDLSSLEEYLKSNNIEWLKLTGAGGGGSFICKPKNNEEFKANLSKDNINYQEVKIDMDGVNICNY